MVYSLYFPDIEPDRAFTAVATDINQAAFLE